MSDRRTEILRVARELAAAEGMDSLSVRTVAIRAGIGASTLRHYFPTQQDLFDAVLEQAFNAQLDDRRIDDPNIPPPVRLTECMQQFLPDDDTHAAQLEGFLASYASALGPGRTEHGRAALTSLSRHARERIVQWLTLLDEEGTLLLPTIDQATTILLATVNGLCLELFTPGSPTNLQAAQSALAHVIETALVDPRPSAK